MAQNIAPRQILRDILHGIEPVRPLFVPIVFALGARAENLPMRAFLGNPTKISNSLRQIRAPLRSDGVSCYFDSLLEAEALGGTLEWGAEGELPVVRFSHESDRGQLPAGLISSEDVVKRGRVPVALEVIRRLKALQRDDFLLTAGVSGPFALAVRLTGLCGHHPLKREDLADSALEAAAAAVMHVAKAFAEAGVNIVFLREDVLPTLREENAEEWMSILTPIFNIIRFYEALPVLQIADDDAFAPNRHAILQLTRGCVACPTLGVARNLSVEERSGINLGIGLPTSALQQDQRGDASFDESLGQTIRDLRPAIVTTVEDVPSSTDLKRLAAISEVVRKC